MPDLACELAQPQLVLPHPRMHAKRHLLTHDFIRRTHIY